MQIPVTPYADTTVELSVVEYALSVYRDNSEDFDLIGRSLRVIEYHSLDGEAVFAQWVREFEERFPYTPENPTMEVIDALQLVYDNLGVRQVMFLVDIGIEARCGVQETFGKELVLFTPELVSWGITHEFKGLLSGAFKIDDYFQKNLEFIIEL